MDDEFADVALHENHTYFWPKKKTMMEFNELYLQVALGTVAFYRSLLTAQPTRLHFRGKCKVEAPTPYMSIGGRGMGGGLNYPPPYEIFVKGYPPPT
jgi:hypothetical protein